MNQVFLFIPVPYTSSSGCVWYSNIHTVDNSKTSWMAGELPIYASTDERIVELQGEASKVLKAVEAVVRHLRKFLVDHSVLPLFEKSVSPHMLSCTLCAPHILSGCLYFSAFKY